MSKALEQSNVVPINESTALVQAITSATANPSVDAEKMERLLSVYERVEARKAESAYADAFASMQIELPAIAERGNAAGRYTYALWEDINTAIKPVLAKYGFALSFRMDFSNGIGVAGVLTHRGGHKETTSIILPSDKSGNKNDVQAVASAVQYGKRYTASALLNLTSYGEDDDAYRTAAPSKDREWIDKVNVITDYPKYLKAKAEMTADYGSVNNIPKSVREAFNAIAAATKPKD